MYEYLKVVTLLVYDVISGFQTLSCAYGQMNYELLSSSSFSSHAFDNTHN